MEIITYMYFAGQSLPATKHQTPMPNSCDSRRVSLPECSRNVRRYRVPVENQIHIDTGADSGGTYINHMGTILLLYRDC